LVRELKRVPHEDGLLTLVEDPSWARERRGVLLRHLAMMMGWMVGFTALGSLAAGAAGIDPTAVIMPLTVAGSVIGYPIGRVQRRASLAIRIDHVGITVGRVYGDVRMSEVMDRTARRRPARFARDAPELHILWEDVEDVRWSDVHLEIRYGGGQVQRFDMEDHSRDDIARLGEEIRSVWRRGQGSRADRETADAVRRKLAQAARRRSEGA